jgi:hypothetical protein
VIQVRTVAVDPDNTAPILNLTTREGMVSLYRATPDGMIMRAGDRDYAFSRDSLIVMAHWLLATGVSQGGGWTP